MIFVQRPPLPPVLAAGDSLAAEERRKVAEWFLDPTTRHKPFKKFSVYKHGSVVAELQRAFAGKCAYCESSYIEVAPVDVEHVRPKGGVAVDGRLEVPGYWWLASEWTNLLPSCIDCNRERTHDFPDRQRLLSGKANRFPLLDEARRARSPGDERHERPLLLNPCVDRPERHLAFARTGLVSPRRRDRRAATSIEVYGLNRDGLVRARKRELKHLLAAIKRVIETAEDLDRHPADPVLALRLERAFVEVLGFTSAERPYAQMARQMIAEFRDGVR